ncbi:hypothetical protein ACKC5O_00570 [Aeromonas schubertii]|uniref:hypothetical protein n=1 Tax=Aeromonas schubertii TaxID=652 RepID=UPI0038B47E5D
MSALRPTAIPCDLRMATAIKAAVRELALELELGDVVSLAHAAGHDRSALLLRQELEARSPKKAATEHQA